MKPETMISEDEFDVIAHKAGLQLSAAQRHEMYLAFAYVRAMSCRVRNGRDISAAPSNIFIPAGTGYDGDR